MLSEGATYAPAGPDAEAAIEIEIQKAAGPIYFRIPASTFAAAFGKTGDSREHLFRAFIAKKFNIWPKLSKKVTCVPVGELYTVTPQDLR